MNAENYFFTRFSWKLRQHSGKNYIKYLMNTVATKLNKLEKILKNIKILKIK